MMAAPSRAATILITGATRGIGLATAAALAAGGARLIVHGRDPGRVEAACDRLARSTPGAAIEGIVADLGSQAEVRRLAADVAARHDRIDVLINNAGLVTRRRQLTVDGLERQLAVNHLAPFLLTHLLLDRLRAGTPARIINVASMAHHRAAFDLDDLNWEHRRYSSIGAYGATKLANILFTRELARRLAGSGITANSLHPGLVATHLFAGMGLLGAVFGILSKPLLRSPAEGAKTSVFVATAAELQQRSGEFFSDCHAVAPSPAASDDATARALWQSSEHLTGLSTPAAA